MNCRDIQDLIALYVEGDLPAAEVPRVESHLQACSACQALAQDIQDTVRSLRSLREEPIPEDWLQRFGQAMQKIREGEVKPPSPSRFLKTPAWLSAPSVRWALGLAALLIALGVLTRLPEWRSMLPSPRPPEETKTAPVVRVEEENSPYLYRHGPSPRVLQSPRIAGRVTDPQGRPLKGATITILDVTQKVLARVVSGKDGTFAWVPRPGQVASILEVKAQGFATRYLYLDHETSEAKEVLIALNIAPSPARRPQDSELTATAIDSGVEGGVPAGVPGGKPEGIPGGAPAALAYAETARGYYRIAPEAWQKTLSEADEFLVVAVESPTLQGEPPVESRQAQLRAVDDRGQEVGVFPLKHTEVTAEISGYLASTRVEQVYTNPFRDVIEAVYVFPLPTTAAVHDFVMKVGGRKVVGVVRPREEAERIYREARARGYTASLLTQERPNVFTQQVANIEPGGEVRVEITYFETLRYEDGWYEYVFPMVVGPRYIPGRPQPPTDPSREPGGGFSPPTDRVPDADRVTPPVVPPGQRSGHDIDITVDLEAGLPIQELDIPSHRVDVEDRGASRRVIRLKPADRVPNRDFVLRWKVAGQALQFGVLTHRDREDGFFTLLLQPPAHPSDDQVMPREITFILDISGSMSGVPIETSKKVVQATLDRMRPSDLFNIVVFANGDGQLWERPRPATPENIAEARAYLQSLQGSGGTEMLAGLRRALRSYHDPRYLQMYVFLTDGYIGNEVEILRTIRTEGGDARFFAFGIGSSVNRYLIEGIGEFGRGRSMIVLPRDGRSLDRAVTEFLKAIDAPVLVDIELQWKGVTVSEVYPERVPDLFAGQTLTVIGRYPSAATGSLLVRGRLGKQVVEYEIPVRFPARQAEHRALAPVWARMKIHDLMKRLTEATEEEERHRLTTDITDLGVKYKLVTPFTAFVAVDESRIVGDGRPVRIFQPVELPQDVDYKGIFGEKPVGRPMHVPAWGVDLVMDSKGQVRVARVEPQGALARAGIRPGAVLVLVERTRVVDLVHLEGLLLQVPRGTVRVTFTPGGTVTLPTP